MLQRIGRYEILERIATGGQGTVYRARDTVLDRVVAVKVINQPVTDDPQYLEALQREARLAARLDHPNVTRVYDFQVEDGTAFITMEYVPDSLDKHIRAGQPLPYQEAVEIAVQVCRGLAHAHENGVIHRDIKPQNILLTEDGTVKVSDFGIARALASSTRSQTNSVMGTPHYMAPEQWESGRLDARLDQYGLAIVLYETLSGMPPFQGESMAALFVQHREAPVPPIPGHLDVPRAVEDVVRQALEKNPEDRFANASAMAGALEGALTGAVSREPRPAQPPTPGTPAAPPPRPPQPPSVGAGTGGGRTGSIPVWLMFGGLGAVVLVALTVVATMVIGGDGNNGNRVQVVVPAPTVTPRLTYTPLPPPVAITTYGSPKEVLLSSNSGPQGKAVTVVGKGFQSGNTETLWLDKDNDGVRDSNERTLGSAEVDNDGNFVFPFTVIAPPFEYGTAANQIRAVDEQYNVDDGDTATFTLLADGSFNPNIAIHPKSVKPGDFVTINGSGFPDFYTVSPVSIGGIDVTLWPIAVTHGDGAFTVRALVPGLPVDTYSVVATVGGVTSSEPVTIGKGDYYRSLGRPVVAVTPDVSRPGRMIELAGMGFPAYRDLQTLEIGGVDVNSWPITATDGDGAFTVRALVPGLPVDTYSVVATVGDVTGSEPVTIGKGDYYTFLGGMTVTLTPFDVRPGRTIKLLGMGPAYTYLQTLDIRGIDVRPSPRVATDGDGYWTLDVVVPNLPVGEWPIYIAFGGATDYMFLNIVP